MLYHKLNVYSLYYDAQYCSYPKVDAAEFALENLIFAHFLYVLFNTVCFEVVISEALTTLHLKSLIYCYLLTLIAETRNEDVHKYNV